MSLKNKVEIIAEIGSNWRDHDEIFNMVVEAKRCGCDYAKLQLYETDTIKRPWESNYDWLKQKQIPKHFVRQFVNKCLVEKIKPMFSVFSEDRLGWLAPHLKHIDTIKIAARSCGDSSIPILPDKRYLVTISSDVDLFRDVREEYRSRDNLRIWRMWTQSRRSIIDNGLVPLFPDDYRPNESAFYDGLSDHAVGIEPIKFAIDCGARIIEKHFTMDPNAAGWDQPGSATPDQMAEIVEYARSKNKE